MRAAFIAVGGVLVLAVSGCGGSASTPATPPTSPAPSPTPTRPAVLAAGPHCQGTTGHAVAFEDPASGLYLRVALARPRISDHALSSYARGPASGHFVIVDTAVQNLGDSALLVNPTQFVLTTTSGRKLTVESGNSPFSGASRVLDQTYLTTGASEHGSLIFDSPQTHGHITFMQGRKVACTWTI
jgi:hypothetical protein